MELGGVSIKHYMIVEQFLMKNFFRVSLLVVRCVALAILLVLGACGVLSDIFGPPTYEKILSYLNILWIDNIFWILFVVCFAVFLATYWLEKKLN